MAKYLTHGDVKFPSQGSSKVQVLVKHFENNVSFDDLQNDINDWLIHIGTDAVLNRPVIKDINFSHYHKPDNPGKNDLFYLCQIHFLLIGDAAPDT